MFTQFVTLDDAKAIAAQLGTIGGGIKDIYIPDYGIFATPTQIPTLGGDRIKSFYHFRFANGADGINAGLVGNFMLLFPTRWAVMIGEQVAAEAKG